MTFRGEKYSFSSPSHDFPHLFSRTLCPIYCYYSTLVDPKQEFSYVLMSYNIKLLQTFTSGVILLDYYHISTNGGIEEGTNYIT